MSIAERERLTEDLLKILVTLVGYDNGAIASTIVSYLENYWKMKFEPPGLMPWANPPANNN